MRSVRPLASGGPASASETNVTSWIRRREKVCLRPEEGHKRAAVHPSRQVAQAADEWMQRWGTCTTTGDLIPVLQAHPLLAEVPFDFEFAGADLLRSANSMVHKAAGPDEWQCASWILLPAGFWAAFARLWQQVLVTSVVPQRWREGRVVLIEKPSGGFRPLTILSCAWRIGARLLVRRLTDWIDR